MLNLKHLYYYYVFAQELSTTKAAKRLKISPPALSNQLKLLEEFVGAPLITRANGKVIFTEPGTVILHYADKMFAAYDELQERLSTARDLSSNRLRVGISQNIGVRFSFDLLALVEKSVRSESQNVHLIFDSTDRLLAAFMKNEFDLILGAFSADHAEENKWITQRLAFPVRLFAPRRLDGGSEAADARKALLDPTQIVERANAEKIAFVLPVNSSVLRAETDHFLAGSRVQPAKTFECNSSYGIVELIELGLAMGFAPIPCLLDFKSARMLTVLGPPEGYWSHGISLFLQKGEKLGKTNVSRLADASFPASEFN